MCTAEATPHRTQLASVPRPSTGQSQFQLPTDQAMLERFQDGATPAYGLLGEDREGTVGRGTSRSGASGLFERTII